MQSGSWKIGVFSVFQKSEFAFKIGVIRVIEVGSCRDALIPLQESHPRCKD